MHRRVLLLLAIPAFLLVWAVADDRKTADPTQGLDFNYFQDKIEPILKATCATQGCHGSKGAGNLHYEMPDFFGRFTAEQSRANFVETCRFLVAKQPMASPFLTKPLAEAEGGLPHGGGAQYAIHKSDRDYQTLVDFIQGAKLADVAPTAVAAGPQRVKKGATVKLDGSKSVHRTGNPFTLHWSFESRPKESRAALSGADTPAPSFVADCDGTYTVTLTATDDKGKSGTDGISVVADSLPILMIEAEDGQLKPPMERVADRTASGGAFICVSDPDAEGGSATYDLDVPEKGDYDLWGKVYVPPGAPGRFLVSMDGGEERPWEFAGLSGWGMVPLREKAVSRKVVSGQWNVKDGGLTCTAFAGKGYALVSTGAKLREGTIDVKARCERPQKGQAMNGFVIFDYRGPQNFKYVAFYGGRQVWAIGQTAGGGGSPAGGGSAAGKDGRPRPNADEFALKWDPLKWSAVSVDLAGRTATLKVDGKEVGKRTYEGTFVGEVGLGALSSNPVFGDLKVTNDAGETVYEDHFNAKGKGGRFALAAGAHKMTVRCEGSGIGLDQIILIKSELEANVDVETRRFIRKAYFDCVGRGPTELEILIASGMSRKAFVAQMTRSFDFFQNWYESELFYFLLLDNFRPSTPSITAIPSRLQNGQISVQDALKEIVISQFFNARNPGPDTFVTVVFEQLLGMKVQSHVDVLDAGKKMYDGYVGKIFGTAGKNQSDVVKIAMEQPDFYTLYLKRVYRRILGHDPSPEALAAAVERFQKNPYSFSEMVQDWLLSEDYAKVQEELRPKSDEEYIRTIYVDLMGRQATFEEVRKMRNALLSLSDKQPLRSVLAKIMIDSNQVSIPDKKTVDKAKWVGEQFLKFLGREPNGQELEAYKAVLDDPAGTTKLVIQGIVTSTEYQYY